MGNPVEKDESSTEDSCGFCTNCIGKKNFPIIQKHSTCNMLFDLFVAGDNKIDDRKPKNLTAMTSPILPPAGVPPTHDRTTHQQIKSFSGTRAHPPDNRHCCVTDHDQVAYHETWE